jgi:hypothetical protein
MPPPATDAPKGPPQRIKLPVKREPTVRQRYGLTTGTIGYRYLKRYPDFAEAVPMTAKNVYRREPSTETVAADGEFADFIGRVWRCRDQAKQGKDDSWGWRTNDGRLAGTAKSEADALERLARAKQADSDV